MSKNQDSQQNEEDFYLRKFLSFMDMDKYKYFRGNNPPDFILVENNKQIAVEMTGFHSKNSGGYPLRMIEESWKKLSRAIDQERKALRKFNNVNCMLRFRERRAPSSAERQEFIQNLFSFIEEKLKDRPQFSNNDVVELQRDFDIEPDQPLLFKYMYGVRIYEYDFIDTPWNWNQSAGFVGVTEAEVKQIVDEKSKIFGKYEDAWLLIYCGPSISQSMGTPDSEKLNSFVDLNKAIFLGPHSRVYIFEYMHDHVLEWERNRRSWVDIRKEKKGTIPNG